MDPDAFREAGYQTVDAIADFLSALPERPVSPGESPSDIRGLLGDRSLPERGTPANRLLSETASLLFERSVFNGHPRFWGYITASPAPIGALADLLASTVNPNVGAWALSPLASAIEEQTVRWVAELLGYPRTCGGLLVSGGNVANFVAFLAARRRTLGETVRSEGVRSAWGNRARVYCSMETHTWIEKAADQVGIGTEAIRWVPVDDRRRMDVAELRQRIEHDRENGETPLLVVGTAGSVALGAVDPLTDIAAVCREHGLWFHVDGAYGGFAAGVPNAPRELDGLSEADSVAVDPHKWLYSALEAGCVLVRDPQALTDAFSFHPSYYEFDGTAEEAPVNYLEHGPQNSRGFRALKVWLGLRQAGREGYVHMISNDIRLAEHLHELVARHPELEAHTHNLSITTFRYVPSDLQVGLPKVETYLNHLNKELLMELQNSGQAFLSNAVVEDAYLLRACIVNFRTSWADIKALPEIVAQLGSRVDAAM